MDRGLVSNYAEQIRGVSYKPNDLHDGLDKDSVILLRANNIDDGKINFDDVVYVDRKKVSKSQYLQKGDILICASSGSKNLVGKAASVDFGTECTFGAFCKVVRPTKVTPEFLGLFFQSPSYRRKISALAQGANINNIKNEHIDNLQLAIYREREQRQIIERLARVITIIHARKDELSKLDELIKARFVEMFRQGYPEDTILNLCNIIDYRGKTPEKVESGLPFITAKNVKMHKMSLEPREYISKETYDKVMVRGFPKEGDVVFTTEAPLGNVCRIPYFDTEFYIGQRIVTLQTEKLIPTYLEYAVSTEEFKRKYMGKSSGSTVTGIRVRLLEQLTIPVPPLELQKQFGVFVEQVDKSKAVIQKSLDETQILFDSLMQEYFG